MVSAVEPRRAILAAACGAAGLVVGMLIGYLLSTSLLTRDWLVYPTALSVGGGLLSDTAADLLLNLVKVLLLAASAVLVVVRARESLVLGLLTAVVLVAANASVQAIKYWTGQPGVLSDLEPLSGHAALVGAVTLSWLATYRGERVWRAAGLGVAALVVTGLAAVVPGLHSPVQVVCPMIVCLGWASGLLVLDSGATFTARPGQRRTRRGVWMAAVGFVLVLAAFLPPSWRPAASSDPEDVLRLILIVAFVLGGALVVVGIAVECRAVSIWSAHAPAAEDGQAARHAGS